MNEDLVLPGGIEIPAREIEVSYSRSSGPGGQHVNKTETRVSLRFAALHSPSLTEESRRRLREKLGSRLTAGGEILVHCDRHRDRSRNHAEALARLRAILSAALYRPRKRRPTRPTRSSVERRLDHKRRQSSRKRDRRRPRRDDD